MNRETLQTNCRQLLGMYPVLAKTPAAPWVAVFVGHDFTPAVVAGALKALTAGRKACAKGSDAWLAALAGEAFLMGLERLVADARADSLWVVPPASHPDGGNRQANAAG